ncbi:MAG: recombination mediator RecR [Planctomycetia bacterium]
MAYPKALEELVRAFERFPGIGRRSAERLAFHVLRDPEARELARAIDSAVERVRRCATCGNATDHALCGVCSDKERDHGAILVVEEPRQVETLEASRAWKGLYHVLYGALNPAEGTEARHLSIQSLVARAKDPAVREVALGTDPDAEGEVTALACLEALESLGRDDLVVTRLARGLPAGTAIEYLHKGILEDALEHRRAVRGRKR